MDTRPLTPTDRPALDALLVCRAQSATFLRAATGEDALDAEGDGRGIWVGAFAEDELRAVALHRSFGILNVEGEIGPSARAGRVALGLSGRPFLGVLGPYDATQAVLESLSLGSETLRFDSHEALYELRLDAIALPPAMADGTRGWRAPREDDLPTLYRWRAEYEAELSLGRVTEALFDAARAKVDRFYRTGELWVTVETADDLPRACATWNAAIPDRVQIGGVFTPPADRGKGYGRSVVAGALLAARESGRDWGSLFTADHNLPARRAYEAIGFEQVGWYGIRLLREPLPCYGPCP